jgi:hypothetical protein
VNPIPQPSEAKPDLARTLRESCVRFTEAADESFFFRQLYLLLAALFGKIEDMFLLWKAGTLPPPPVRQQTARAPEPSRATARRHKTARRPTRARRTSTARPIRVRRTAARPGYLTEPVCRVARDAPVRRIDRPPKPRTRQNRLDSETQTHVIFITISKQKSIPRKPPSQPPKTKWKKFFCFFFFKKRRRFPSRFSLDNAAPHNYQRVALREVVLCAASLRGDFRGPDAPVAPFPSAYRAGPRSCRPRSIAPPAWRAARGQTRKATHD